MGDGFVTEAPLPLGGGRGSFLTLGLLAGTGTGFLLVGSLLLAAVGSRGARGGAVRLRGAIGGASSVAVVL